MKSNSILRYIVFAFILLYTFAYGQNGALADECKNNFTTSCLVLLDQAKKQHDAKSSDFYRAKLLDIMESACKRDYQTCLVLARIYEPQGKGNAATQAIQRDMIAHKIPTQVLLPTFSENPDKAKKHFEDIESVVAVMREKPNADKAVRYQEKSIGLLENACYDSNVQACLFLHYFYEHGVAVAQNRPKAERLVTLALELATRECMLGNTKSCELLRAYPAYRQWIAKEAGNLVRKCNEQDFIACYQSSLYYTQDFYINPEASKIAQDNTSDFIKVAQLLQKACKIDTNSCKETIFHIKNAKECLIDNNMQACANTQNVRPEFLALACNDGNMHSCYTLRHLPTFNDSKRYVKLLQRVCRSGIIDACVELANMYEKGERVAKSKEKTLHFMQRACAWSMKQQVAGDYCYFAGLGYERGEYVKQDIEKAIETYQYACEIGHKNTACERLGTLYEHYRQNMPEALIWYQKACNANKNSIMSCMQVAKNFANGEYLSLSVQDAIHIYELLLQEKEAPHDDIYYNLAKIYGTKDIYDIHTRTAKENPYSDYAKALQYYKKSCKLGFQTACTIKLTLPNLTQECQANNANACYQIATLISLLQEDASYRNMLTTPNIEATLPQITNNTKPIAKDDKAISLMLYKQACKGNVASACIKLYETTKVAFDKDFDLQEAMCINLRTRPEAKAICLAFAHEGLQQEEYQKVIHALLPYQSKEDSQALDLLAQAYFYAKDYKQTLEIYKRIYHYNIPNDYYYLAQMYSYGLEVKQDYQKALDIYRLSESPRSYLGQAQMYANGLGVSKSIFSAKDYYKLACPLHTSDTTKVLAEACVQLGSIMSDEGDFKIAQQYYLKACEIGYHGDAISCQ